MLNEKRVARKPHKNEKGMATLETLPLLFIFLFLTSYTLGFFGVIHTAILSSIGSRAYAFETFRNRSNLLYFRDIETPFRKHFKNERMRRHMVLSENRDDDQMRAVERAIRLGVPIQAGPSRNDPSIHNDKLFNDQFIQDKRRNTQVEVSPVWLMIGYGICLDTNCGGD